MHLTLCGVYAVLYVGPQPNKICIANNNDRPTNFALLINVVLNRENSHHMNYFFISNSI